MREPEGVTVADCQSGALRHETRWTVWVDGRLRVLELRVGRGTVRDVTASEAENLAWERIG